MLDTVVLTLAGSDFAVTNPLRFGPVSRLPGGGERRFQNNTEQEKRANVSKPGLTWSRRPFSSSPELRIEVSIPKMYLGSNLSEVGEADLPGVTEKLSQALAEMGVDASPESLARAKVSKIHFSKNIVLPEGTTVSKVFWTLRRGLTSSRRDRRETHWENEGEGLRLRTTERELLMYDKLADLKKSTWSPKRSSDPLSCGLPLRDLSELPRGSQVLRIEVRLNTPRSLRAALRQTGRPINDPRLADVFSEEVSKAVLLYELRPFGEASAARSQEATPGEMFDAYLANGMKPDLALKAMTVAELDRDLTPLGLRKLLRDRGVAKHFWYRLNRFRRISRPTARREDLVAMLRRTVDQFELIRSASPPSPPLCRLGSITAARRPPFLEIPTEH